MNGSSCYPDYAYLVEDGIHRGTLTDLRLYLRKYFLEPPARYKVACAGSQVPVVDCDTGPASSSAAKAQSASVVTASNGSSVLGNLHPTGTNSTIDEEGRQPETTQATANGLKGDPSLSGSRNGKLDPQGKTNEGQEGGIKRSFANLGSNDASASPSSLRRAFVAAADTPMRSGGSPKSSSADTIVSLPAEHRGELHMEGAQSVAARVTTYAK